MQSSALWHESSHKKDVNECVWLLPNKTSLTKTDNRLDLAMGYNLLFSDLMTGKGSKFLLRNLDNGQGGLGEDSEVGEKAKVRSDGAL